MSKPLTRPGDLLERLLAGESLVKCHGVGWTIGPDAAPVPDVLVQSLRGGTFRLTVGGDGLPGLGTSQTMRLVRVPTSVDLLARLRHEMEHVGGLSAWARRNGISKGAVGNVEACSRDMTDGVAEKLGFARITHLWRPLSQRGAA